MTILWTTLTAVILFSLLIFVHELGHFLFARAFGIKVNEFAIGMGPAFWKKEKGETVYSIRWFPIGGYCKMEGENGDSEDPASFGAKPWWARFIVLAGGAAMNLVLGFVVALFLVGVMGWGGGTIGGFIKEAYLQTLEAGKIVILSIEWLVSGKVKVTEMSGPVGIVNVIAQVTSMGIPYILNLAIFITVNLGLFNLLPIPALDGGRIVFVLIEAVRRKKIKPDVEGLIHGIGFLLLIGLVLFATWNDILRLAAG